MLLEKCGILFTVFCHYSNLLLDRIAHTMYVGAVCCYRPSSVVCRSVCRSVSYTSDPAKTAEPIQMPFGLRTRLGSGNHVLDGGPDPQWEVAISTGKGASHCKV